MKLNDIYNTVEEKIGRVFESYGRFVANHAVKVLMVTVVLNVALGMGMLKMKRETNTDEVYFPMGSQASKDRERVQKVYPDVSSTNYNSFQLATLGTWAEVIVRAKNGNVLERETLGDIARLNIFIKNITAQTENSTLVFYSDLCAKTMLGCYSDGDIFFSRAFLRALDNETISYPLFTHVFGTRHIASNLGGRKVVVGQGQNRYIRSAEFMRLKYPIRTDGQEYEQLSELWLEEFISKVGEISSEYFDIAFAHSNSLDEELDKNIKGDITLFSITITLMITYSCLATMSASCNCVGQRVNLGYAGTVAAGLAIVASFGLCSAIGVSFVSIVGVVPFLVIGIGIDDMFILLSGLAGAQGLFSVKDKMGQTLRTSGVSITITSITDLLAFMAGASSSFLAVRNFCIYTGFAVIFCYINNITIVASCMAINERRVGQKRHFATCLPVRSKVELRDEKKPPRSVFCCGGNVPSTREEVESLVDKFPRWLLPKIVLKAPLKVLICLIFAVYVGASVYGCIELKQGLKFDQLVEETSYFYKYSQWKEDNFKRLTPVSFVIDTPYAYSSQDVQNDVARLLSNAKADDYIYEKFENSWLSTYKQTDFYNDTSEEAFIQGLKLFFLNPWYRRFQNDVVINNSSSKIISSRVYVVSVDMGGSQEEGKLMLRARDVAKSAPLSCFAYSPAFVPYEQYVAILPQTLQTVGLAVIAVFIVTCFFMPHPLLILLVTVAVAMIMAGVFGFLYYLDLSLSSITMIHVIMSIGFSIDFAAHICHGFMISNGASRNERVQEAINKTGAPIFHGAVSSLLGIVVLVFARSYIFQTFAQVMALVLVFGIMHALFLLTVLLSWLGPNNKITKDSEPASISKET